MATGGASWSDHPRGIGLDEERAALPFHQQIMAEFALVQRSLVEARERVLSLVNDVSQDSAADNKIPGQVSLQPVVQKLAVPDKAPLSDDTSLPIIRPGIPRHMSPMFFKRPAYACKSPRCRSTSNSSEEELPPEDVISLPALPAGDSAIIRLPALPAEDTASDNGLGHVSSTLTAITHSGSIRNIASNVSFAAQGQEQNPLGRGAAEKSRPYKMGQSRRWLSSYKVDSFTEPTIVETICVNSVAARWAFFFGGLAVWNSQISQCCYDAVFMVSFASCFFMCCFNYYYKTPPYYDSWIDAATIYFHIVGVHTWLVWRNFVRLPTVKLLAGSLFRRSNDAEAWEHHIVLQLMNRTRWIAWALVFTQVTAIVLGFFAFSQPALEWWIADGGSHLKSRFALVHALVMYFVIPQHVPTMVASLGLFMFLCRLHTLDMERIVALVDDSSSNLANELEAVAKVDVGQSLSDNQSARRAVLLKDPDEKLIRAPLGPQRARETLQQEMHTCCELSDVAQAHLDFSAGRFQYIWVHQILYCFFQILIVIAHVRYDLRSGDDTWHLKWHIYRRLYDTWHCYIALLVFLAVLVAPAMVTKVFNAIPQRLLRGMRYRGANTADAAQLGTYLTLRIQGYRVFGVEVKLEGVYTCITLILCLTSLYLSDFMQMY